MVQSALSSDSDVPDSSPRLLEGTRILVVMPSVPLYGMEWATLQIMKMMRQRRAGILFVMEQTYGEHVCREVERIGCEWAGIPFQGRPSLPRGVGHAATMAKNWRVAASGVRALRESYRPSHIYVTNLSYLLYSLPALRGTRAPVVFRVPNPPAANLPSRWKQKLSDVLWRCVVAPSCDVLVCNSEYAAGRLKAVGVDMRQVRVIRNCLAVRDRRAVAHAPSLSPDTFNVVYVGKIRKEKGVAELVTAAERFVREDLPVRFYLAGEYHWENPFAEALLREVRSKGLEGKILFLGEIREVFGLLRQADLHVCPSVSPNDSFPNVLLEAKSCGVPSVVFPTAGLPEAVTHRKDGYVCASTSADALYEGIRYFLDDIRTRKTAAEAARASLDGFSQERAAQEWQDLFLSLQSATSG